MRMLRMVLAASVLAAGGQSFANNNEMNLRRGAGGIIGDVLDGVSDVLRDRDDRRGGRYQRAERLARRLARVARRAAFRADSRDERRAARMLSRRAGRLADALDDYYGRYRRPGRHDRLQMMFVRVKRAFRRYMRCSDDGSRRVRFVFFRLKRALRDLDDGGRRPLPGDDYDDDYRRGDDYY